MVNLNKKNLVFSFLIIIVGITIFFYLVPPQYIKKNPKPQLSENFNQEIISNLLTKEKQTLSILLSELGVNYCSKFPECSQIDLSLFMLNRISKLADQCGVILLSFSPAEKVVQGIVTRISFSVMISAPFSRMVNFFQQLEKKEKISLDRLKITTGLTFPLQHQAEFELVCWEINEPIVLGFTREIQKYRDNFSPKEEAKTVNRDPFLNVKIQSPNLDKQNLRLKENQTDRLKLTGINYSANSRTAIINRHIVAEGDLIAGWKIVEIRKDRVILELKNKRSSLYLNQNPSLRPAEENPLFTKEE